jgi:hypothetical protein
VTLSKRHTTFKICFGKTPIQELLALVLGEGLFQSENLWLFLLVLVGDFLATLALYIPYSLLPETAMAHGISQVIVHSILLAACVRFSGHLGPLHPLLTASRNCDGSWNLTGNFIIHSILLATCGRFSGHLGPLHPLLTASRNCNGSWNFTGN